MTKQRNDIENKYKWDLEKIYANNEEIEIDVKEVEKYQQEIKKYKGKLSKSIDNLYGALQIMENSSKIVSKLYVYANMKSHEDTRINENQALATKMEMLSTEMEVETSYIIPEILAMKEETLKEYLNDSKLVHYKKMIDNILRQKPHTLNESEEKILASVSELATVPENIYEMLAYADMEFPTIKDENEKDIKITHFNYSKLIKSENQRVRKDAFKAEFSTYDKYKNAFASMLFGSIKSEVFYAKTRKYKNDLAASLFSDDINEDVYVNLIDAIHKGIPALDNYINIKKKALKLEKMHMYDLYVPMLKDFEMKISYEEAQKIILEALKPLGKDYLSIVRKAFDERWIDVYENEGKKGGAYSWGSYGTNPYILMSYTDDLNSMFTLIHELGHSLHSYYSRKAQPYIYSSYKIFVAEVASTVNETLLIKYLLKNAKNKDEKIYLLNYYLEQFRTTVYRQTLFAEFEKITHAKVESGLPMTAETFSKIYYDLNKKYYGNSCVVDKEIEVEWARIPHFYSSFYVYKYATGFSAAAVLSAKILNNNEEDTKKYLEFLKSGGSEFPIEQLKKAGVDMQDKNSISNSMEIFEELTKQLDSIL